VTDETTGGGGKRGKDLADEMLGSAHRVWLAGLGALARAEEEGSRLFSQLVERGRESEVAGRGRFDETVRGAAGSVRSAAETVSAGIEAQVGEVMRRMGVPTRDEIQELTRRVEELNAKIDRMGASAPRPATAKPSKAPGGAKS